mgnify:CR=1 FL=1
MVSNESTVAELTAKPSFVVANPKVMKTNGEIITTNKSHIVSLFSLLAQIALMEFAARAIRTALIT